MSKVVICLIIKYRVLEYKNGIVFVDSSSFKIQLLKTWATKQRFWWKRFHINERIVIFVIFLLSNNGVGNSSQTKKCWIGEVEHYNTWRILRRLLLYIYIIILLIHVFLIQAPICNVIPAIIVNLPNVTLVRKEMNFVSLVS